VDVGADASVFAPGAGPGSGAEKKLPIDRDGAIELLRPTQVVDVERYEPRSVRRTLYVRSGDDPVDEALERVLGG
jgi:hypothetical protein